MFNCFNQSLFGSINKKKSHIFLKKKLVFPFLVTDLYALTILWHINETLVTMQLEWKKTQTKQQKRTDVIVGRFHNNPKKLNHTREIRTRSQKEKIIKYTHNNKDWKSLVGDKVPHYENCFWKKCVKESVSVTM